MLKYQKAQKYISQKINVFLSIHGYFFFCFLSNPYQIRIHHILLYYAISFSIICFFSNVSIMDTHLHVILFNGCIVLYFMVFNHLFV